MPIVSQSHFSSIRRSRYVLPAHVTVSLDPEDSSSDTGSVVFQHDTLDTFKTGLCFASLEPPLHIQPVPSFANWRLIQANLAR